MKIKNWYTRDKGCFDLFYCLCVGFRPLGVFATCVELPYSEKSDRIFKQIILVTSKGEGKIQKLYFCYSGNFDENMRRPHERNSLRIRSNKKNANQNNLSWLLGNEVPGWGTYLPLKSNEIKYFYELIQEERREKSLKIMIQYKSKENMDYSRLFSGYCDLNLTPWLKFTLYFHTVISYQSLFSVCCCFQHFSRVIFFKYLIHHVFKFIIAQHHYIITTYFWFLILSCGICSDRKEEVNERFHNSKWWIKNSLLIRSNTVQ